MKMIYCFCMAALLIAGNAKAQENNISVATFERALLSDSIQVLDVRTSGEYQSGHLKNAFLADWTNQKEFKERIQSLDKSKPVYTYCLSGGRSDAAMRWLNSNGYKAYNLTGGINAWKREGKSVEAAAVVKQISSQEYFSRIPLDRTALVDFGAVWCLPCKKMSPVIDSLVKTNGHQFVLLKINGAEQIDVAKELGVEAFPTFIIYKNGKEMWRKQGIVDATEFTNQFQKN